MIKKLLKNNESVKVKMNAKQRLHTAICMLSLTVIALTTATYAWFTLSASTRVREFELDVSAGANLKISTIDNGTDIEDYHDEVVSDNGGARDGSEINSWLVDNYRISLSDIVLRYKVVIGFGNLKIVTENLVESDLKVLYSCSLPL